MYFLSFLVVVVGGWVVPSDYLVLIQLQFWLFCCWDYGCWAVTKYGTVYHYYLAPLGITLVRALQFYDDWMERIGSSDSYF